MNVDGSRTIQNYNTDWPRCRFTSFRCTFAFETNIELPVSSLSSNFPDNQWQAIYAGLRFIAVFSGLPVRVDVGNVNLSRSPPHFCDGAGSKLTLLCAIFYRATVGFFRTNAMHISVLPIYHLPLWWDVLDIWAPSRLKFTWDSIAWLAKVSPLLRLS